MLVSTLETFFQGDLPRLEESPAKAAFDPIAGERAELFRGIAIEDVVRHTRPHPVVRFNMAMTIADTPDELRTRLLEHLESVYTDWHERGAEIGIESEPDGNGVRFARTPNDVHSPSGYVKRLLYRLECQFGARPWF